MLRISVITLFPDIFQAHLAHLPLKRAIERNLLNVELINLKDFAIDKRGTVDSPAYGGGPGMILRPEPVYNAVNSVLTERTDLIVFLTPRGYTYNQKYADAYSKLSHMIIVCGRYEGIDQRVIEHFKPRSAEVSIGNFVLSGGEVAAMAIIESSTRLIPDAIGNSEAVKLESFSEELGGGIEYPQYTRPETWMGQHVPEILISGHHKNISGWKHSKQSKES